MELVKIATHRFISSALIRPTTAGGWAVLQSLAAFGGLALSQRERLSFIRWPPERPPDPIVFARVLIVPSLLEEAIFRVVLQPPGSSWATILAVNTCFAAYHLVGAALAESANMQELATTFRDPHFLFLAFVLGNLCSYAYQSANYGLWAPVLVHAVPVAIWLSSLGGETIIRGGRR